ncbi:LysR family transcriptional regulator [Rhodoplanes sp. TEM]|uniref:LysR family transcriptional regulator n=1 Tax=Rhodoplanes tepidamans TaxID=200616 RepID=A0ABT5J397_RHOTP|nr:MULTISPECIES: LysR family transcriptional regulator [Rhodoplanes]MDC7784134.1 LysR family transcriptional regulator [Rhodoplanes tepidamans]MDC7983229.1 LysR family transcriptional regulator [Rhodoplanes sp. TEM]MDQ0356768.1 DNA-binding transcriptional LysR family regulator [Rhodoplanes tepidamans]
MRHLRILRYVDEVARTGSIRKAAERLAVTASAVNRRIMDLEEELGAALFERKPRGVRLTAAGEVFVRYLREQAGDVERMKSQIEDLRGLKRGTVSLACSQALAYDFLPREIATFRARHPYVAFDVRVADHDRAMAALEAYEVDLVAVYRPSFHASFRPLMTAPQRLAVLMPEDHPLAATPPDEPVRLRDCVGHACAVADRSLGGRQLLDAACARTGIALRIVAESNSFEMLRGLVRRDRVLSFQVEIGADLAPRGAEPGVVARVLDPRDVPAADLVVGQLRSRNLPVPAAVFAEQLVRSIEGMRE